MKEKKLTGGRASVRSSMVRGCEAVPIEVEVAVTKGMPSTTVVGMADASIVEARERVRCAVRSAGFAWPDGRVVVNLAPSSLRKCGSGFDLAIAVAVLAATGQVDAKWARSRSFVGELSLDGRILPVRGMYCHAVSACEMGRGLVCSADAGETAHVPGDWWPVGIRDLAELRDPASIGPVDADAPHRRTGPDMADIPGHEAAKRAAQIAAVGRHGLLMVGPHDSFAPLIAARIPSIMPRMGDAESAACASAWSAAGEDPSAPAAGYRPFRAPHHSVTAAGLVGGGSPVLPGEASLAHGGVLFLGDVPEFKPSTLQQLRAPIESGFARIVRADGAIAMPARFLLAASAQPCPCGLFGDPRRPCTCSEHAIRAYQARACGPLADRFDVRVDLTDGGKDPFSPAYPSSLYRDGVEAAWERRAWREARDGAPQDVWGLAESCRLSDSDLRMLEKASEAAALSGRQIVSVLRVARTIADIGGHDAVGSDDIAEALSLRVR